jgi:hypothetical protein
MEVLNFFPIATKQNNGKVTKLVFKELVFGCDNMITLPETKEVVANTFPWSLSQEFINELLSKYSSEPFITVIEVGTHIGTTATRFANAIKNNPDSYIVCIDTWLSDVADYICRKDGMKYNLKAGNDHRLFDKFIQNVKNNNLEQTIIPFRLPSLQAGQVLYYYGIKADIIYIDASHEYLNVKYDLELYHTLVSTNGTLFGDDYHIHGVKRAVDEFVASNNLVLTIKLGIVYHNTQQLCWFISPHPHPSPCCTSADP